MPSIEKRGNNSWRLVVEDGYDVNGKRIQRRKTVRVEDPELLKPTKSAATRLRDYLRLELGNFCREVESGQYVQPTHMTFMEFVPIWKQNFADQNLGAYTRRHYLQMISAHLLPVLGRIDMEKIKTMHLVQLMSQLRTPDARKDGQDKPLSVSTRLNIYHALKSVFDAGYKWRVIPVNPMDGVDRPKPDKAERRAAREKKHAYTRAESQALIIALMDEPERWRLYFLGVLLGGFRRGEMLGVEWPQVDFENGGIFVEKQISLDEDGNAVEAELKTEESRGYVPMPRWYMDELTQYRKQWIEERWKLKQAGKWLGGNKQYVFHPGTGQKYYPSSPSHQWTKFLNRHDLPKIRLHDLRHTAAMLLREAGADMKTIQERLRHARLSTTADMYTHESEVISREAADKLENLNPFPIRSQSH